MGHRLGAERPAKELTPSNDSKYCSIVENQNCDEDDGDDDDSRCFLFRPLLIFILSTTRPDFSWCLSA